MIVTVDLKMIGCSGLRGFGLQRSLAELAAHERGETVSHATAQRGQT